MAQNELSIEVMIRDFKIMRRNYHRALNAGDKEAARLNRIMATRIADRLMHAGMGYPAIARMECEVEREVNDGR